MRLLSNVLFALCCAIQLSSCEIINPEEVIPAYLQIDTISFIHNTIVRGTATQDIVEAWVTVDDDFLGTYDLPATIPVLKTGDARVIVRPGIKDNGIGSRSEIYPFFQPFETIVNLSIDETATLAPTTSYISDAEFAFIEDFEGAITWFSDDLDGDTATVLQPTTTAVFEGTHSGVINLTTEHPIVEVATDFTRRFSELQTAGVEVYLEMHYKTDVQLQIGVIGHNGGVFTPEQRIYEFILFPKAEWNKIYLNLSQVVFALQAETFQITLLAGINAEENIGVQQIFLDNIKLIHF